MFFSSTADSSIGTQRAEDASTVTALWSQHTLPSLTLLSLIVFPLQSTPSPSADLLGLRPAAATGSVAPSAGSLLVDVFSEGPAAPSAGVNDDGFLR